MNKRFSSNMFSSYTMYNVYTGTVQSVASFFFTQARWLLNPTQYSQETSLKNEGNII